MIFFILKRLLFLVPTIFLVLILVYFLNQYSPGDPVESKLRIEGHERGIDPDIYDQTYLKAAESLKANRPIFYFSITPNYIVEELHTILPLPERKTLIQLLRIVKNPDAVFTYYHALNKVSQEYRIQKIIAPRSIINKMKLETNPKEIKERFTDLKLAFGDDSFIFQDLEDAIDLLSSSQKGSVYPVFRWYGLDNQFHFWAHGLLKPHQIRSNRDGAPVLQKIFNALKWTLSLSLISLVFCIIISISIGILQVSYLNSYFDKITEWFLYGFYSIPLFWFATLMVVFFTTPEYGSWTDIFPSIGIKYWLVSESFWVQFSESFKQLILPIICMTLASLPYLTRQLKSDLLKELNLPYILTARAKGLTRKVVLLSHALPNSLIPFISLVTGALPSLFTGSLIIEIIFNIPGVGRLIYESIVLIDWPVTFTTLIIIATVTIVSYLLGDLISASLNPRIYRALGIKD